MDRRNQIWIASSGVICILLIYVFPLTLPTPLLDPDEGLHAAIAQEMVETGDYLVPQFRGEMFPDKPILYFFCQAVSLRVFGMHEAAVRLPGLLFAVIGAMTTALIARRLFDVTTAALAFLISLTLVIPMCVAQAGVHDVALVPWTNLLLLGLWEADRDEVTASQRRWWLLLGSVAAGLAILTKGLIGVAIVFCAYVAYVGVTGRRPILAETDGWRSWLSLLSVRNLRRFVRLAAVIGSGGIIACPWFAAMEFRHPGYLYYYFIERHVLGYATTTQRHGDEPWYFYVMPILAGSMPWVIYSLAGLWQVWHDRRQAPVATGRAGVYVSCWLGGGLIFLSLAKSKLITYTLPVYPAMMILAAMTLSRWAAGRLQPSIQAGTSRAFQAACLLGIPGPFLFAFVIERAFETPVAVRVWLLLPCVSLVSATAWWLDRRKQPVPAIAMAATWMALLTSIAMQSTFQPIAVRYSQRRVAAYLRHQPQLPDRIVIVGGRVGSLVFYLTPKQRQLLTPGSIVEASAREISEWPSTFPKHTLLAVAEDRLDRLPDFSTDDAEPVEATAGTYHLFERRDGVPALNRFTEGEASHEHTY